MKASEKTLHGLILFAILPLALSLENKQSHADIAVRKDMQRSGKQAPKTQGKRSHCGMERRAAVHAVRLRARTGQSGKSLFGNWSPLMINLRPPINLSPWPLFETIRTFAVRNMHVHGKKSFNASLPHAFWSRHRWFLIVVFNTCRQNVGSEQWAVDFSRRAISIAVSAISLSKADPTRQCVWIRSETGPKQVWNRSERLTFLPSIHLVHHHSSIHGISWSRGVTY